MRFDVELGERLAARRSFETRCRRGTFCQFERIPQSVRRGEPIVHRIDRLRLYLVEIEYIAAALDNIRVDEKIAREERRFVDRAIARLDQLSSLLGTRTE